MTERDRPCRFDGSAGRRAARSVLALVLCAGLAHAGGCGIWDDYTLPPEVRPEPVAQTEPEPVLAAIAPEPASTPVPAPLEQRVTRAEGLLKEGKLDAARVEFERVIAINPTIATAYLGAGEIYKRKGDYKSAEERFARAAELAPENFDAQYNHGLTLQLLGRLADSVRAYLRALTIKPDDFDANLNLATAYLQLAEPSQALAYAQRAVSLNGGSAPARTNLGAIYAALDRHTDAITEYQQAAELTKLTAPLLLNMSDSLGKVGRYEEMVNTLREVVREQPSAAAYERLGSGQFRLRRYAEAEDSFRKSAQLQPDYHPALNGVAVCLLNKYMWSGQNNEAARIEAVDLLRRSLMLEKRQPRVAELLGRYQ